MAATPSREAIGAALSGGCSTLDEEIVEYLVNGVLESAEDERPDTEAVREVIGPFLEEQDVDEAIHIVSDYLANQERSKFRLHILTNEDEGDK